MATQLPDLDVDLITRGHLGKGLERLRDEFAGTFSAERSSASRPSPCKRSAARS